jgi:exopolysaccharide production protein ExoZ
VTSKGLNNIQALRAAAALLVVFVHLDVFLKQIGYRPFGAGGVDLFFVISGFIMVYTTYGRPVHAVDFLLSRITRIVPIYWLITFAVFGVALLAPALVQGTTADPVQLLKSLVFVPFVKSSGAVQPVLFSGWTLNFEMFFYALFAVGLAFANRRLGIAAVVGSLAALVVAGAVLHPANVAAEFYTRPVILEFAGGMLLCLLVQRRTSQAVSHAFHAVWIAVGMIALLAIVVLPDRLPDVSSVITTGIPAIACVAAAVLLNQSGVVTANRVLLLLGNASYSIYLTHPFVTQAAQKLVVRSGLDPLKAIVMIPVTLALVCVLGVIVYHAVELPLTRRGKLLADRIPRRQKPESVRWADSR